MSGCRSYRASAQAEHAEATVTYRADQIQENDWGAENSTDEARPENASCSGDTCIFGFFSDVSSGVEASQDTGCEKEGQKPIPTSRCTSPVVIFSEETCILKAVGLGNTDR